MKKLLITVLFVLITLLSSCRAWRENLLAAPDEVTIPEGSLVATCEKDDVIYTHVYQNDGIYEYYIDNVFQDENVTDTIQEQAYLNGESMANYLNDEFGVDGCIIENYVAPTKD